MQLNCLGCTITAGELQERVVLRSAQLNRAKFRRVTELNREMLCRLLQPNRGKFEQGAAKLQRAQRGPIEHEAQTPTAMS
eukprot:1158330-Pelagomonas_calceolata.AAC.10